MSEAAEILAKEMQAIVAADRWKGRDLSAAPPEKWSHLRAETQQFWIDTASRILAAIQPADLVQAKDAEIARLRAELDATALSRKTFPILNGSGARIDYQLVADHGEQAKANHYQSVERLAERGGLSWAELYAVLHNRQFKPIDKNEAMIACRSLEARYLAALTTPLPDDLDSLVQTAQWARNRLEVIADEAWRGDGRDLKRSIIGVFADFDSALLACGSTMPTEIRRIPAIAAREARDAQMLAEGRVAGLREAAKLYEDGAGPGAGGWDYFGDFRDAIRALADKIEGEGDE